MHIEALIFEVLTIFFGFSAGLYGYLTYIFSAGGIEWAGTTALMLTTGLTLITGTFFRFISRRIDTRPEDSEYAEIIDGTGEVGFYAPYSWWPILIAFSFSIIAIGAALWLIWLIVVGICFTLASVSGLVFEYHKGPEKH